MIQIDDNDSFLVEISKALRIKNKNTKNFDNAALVDFSHGHLNLTIFLLKI